MPQHYINVDHGPRDLLRTATANAVAAEREAATRTWEDDTAADLEAYMGRLVTLLERPREPTPLTVRHWHHGPLGHSPEGSRS